MEAVCRQMVVQLAQVKPQDSICKIPKTKRTGGVAQVVECLLSKQQTLSSNTNTALKKQKTKKQLVNKSLSNRTLNFKVSPLKY
jgi:dihydroxyacid dehydratase/phosphogluconate dehydratase